MWNLRQSVDESKIIKGEGYPSAELDKLNKDLNANGLNNWLHAQFGCDQNTCLNFQSNFSIFTLHHKRTKPLDYVEAHGQKNSPTSGRYLKPPGLKNTQKHGVLVRPM